VPIVLKSGSLNPLETSRPVKACNGIALPLHCGCSVLIALNYWKDYPKATVGHTLDTEH
jgi:hypothetical protein